MLAGKPDGAYTLSVRAVSAAGTPGPETARVYVYLRAVPAGVQALNGPKLGTDRAPEWTFTVPDGLTAYCRVTDAAGVVVAEGGCRSPYALDLSQARDGVYVLTVQTVDGAGNRSAPAAAQYRLDTEPTVSPVLVTEPGDTGSSLDPTWQFTVVRGATAQCRLFHDGVLVEDWTACVGRYTALLSGKPDGDYLFQVRAVDAAGNASQPRSDTYRLSRSGVPVPRFTSVPTTPSASPTVVWTFSVDAGSLQCRLTAPGGAPSAWTACDSGRFELALAGQREGLYVLEVQTVLDDGRTGAAAVARHVLDVTPPGLVVLAPAPVAGRGAAPTWTWSATEDLVRCRLLRAGVVLRAWDCSSGDAVDLTPWGQGDYVLEVRQVDEADQASDPAFARYRYDTSPPDAPRFSASARPRAAPTRPSPGRSLRRRRRWPRPASSRAVARCGSRPAPGASTSPRRPQARTC